MLEMGKARGVVVGALVGAKEHAVKQVEAGVDVLIVSGTEAGGHCGEVSTMVLVPEVCQAVADSNVPVLAAGGIIKGRQMAAAMAMGAHGAWTGSMWLATSEAETSQVIKENTCKQILDKPFDQRLERVSILDNSGRLGPMLGSLVRGQSPYPCRSNHLVSEAPLAKVTKLAEGGHQGARQLATSFVGQGVGLIDSIQDTRTVVREFIEDYLSAVERVSATINE